MTDPAPKPDPCLEPPGFLDRRDEVFRPLSPEEEAVVPASDSDRDAVPILPVPDDALPMRYSRFDHGTPTASWPYRNKHGQLLGYICRWDDEDNEGDRKKDYRPVTFCDLGNGQKGWMAKGFPEPRPLYQLHRLFESPENALLIVEGEKAADAAATLFSDLVVTTPPHGAQSPHKADWTPVKGRRVIIWPDNDEAGAKYARNVARLCSEAGAISVVIVPLSSDLPEKWDLADPLPHGWSIDDLKALLNTAKQCEPNDDKVLRAVNIADFMAMEIPPREMLLGPILPSQGLAMLYAKRGVGKTYVALGIAYALATGGSFLVWEAPKPRRVLYLDGEMTARAMQERLAQIIQGQRSEPPDADYLRIITSDLQEEGFPDLSTEAGQMAVEEHLDGVSVVIIDNLSTLCRHGRENEAQSWGPMQDWLISLRRRGVSVLLVHHAGKGGEQRGTSRREDVLDTVIRLAQPEDYRAEQGARFEIHLDKARAVFGGDAKAFEASLEVREGAAIWTTRDIQDRELELVMRLTEEGLSVREIQEETGISKSKVNRIQKRVRDEAG